MIYTIFSCFNQQCKASRTIEIRGAAKYDDLPSLLALLAHTRLWLAGEGEEVPSIVRAAFVAAGEGTNLTTFSSEARDAAKVAVERLLRQ